MENSHQELAACLRKPKQGLCNLEGWGARWEGVSKARGYVHTYG